MGRKELNSKNSNAGTTKKRGIRNNFEKWKEREGQEKKMGWGEETEEIMDKREKEKKKRPETQQ